MKQIPSKYQSMIHRATGKRIPVLKAIDTGKAIHYYYTDPLDQKEKRVIVIKRLGGQ